MKTLDEFNKDRRAFYEKQRQPHANGIVCPKCSHELWDSDPMSTLCSNPPQKNIHCPNCEYRGYRLA